MDRQTTAAKWRDNGEPDPHGKTYECQRHELVMGDLTDDELANAVFIFGNGPFPSIAQLQAGTARPPIVYLTAAKDRIRWLSRQEVAASRRAENAAQLVTMLTEALKEAAGTLEILNRDFARLGRLEGVNHELFVTKSAAKVTAALLAAESLNK